MMLCSWSNPVHDGMYVHGVILYMMLCSWSNPVRDGMFME